MPKPKVVGQPNTTQHLSKGINAIANLLAPTIGPVGGVVANQRDFKRQPELLDDSATTVRRILNLGDPRADVGAMLMRGLIWRVVQRAGDGGTTAAILARAIYNNAVRVIAGGANAMMVAKGVNLAVDTAVAALRKQARPVTYEDELAAVALTVIREPELAAVLGEMSYLLGPDAHVTVEKYVAPYLQQYYHPGASYKAQIASMYLYTEPTQKIAVLPAGVIALVDGKLEKTEQLLAIMEPALKSGARSLAIIAGHFSDEVIGVMVANSRKEKEGENANRQNGNDQNGSNQNGKEKSAKQMVITGVKLKDVGDARRNAYDDLGMLTGATVLGRAWSKRFSTVTAEDLGKTLRVEFAADHVHVVPERHNAPELKQKTAEIREQLARMTLDDEERPVLVKRLSAMTGGMGVLKIGAESKLDREVRAQNAERALRVLSFAQLGGVAPGGGAAYFHSAEALDDLNVQDDITFGVQIIRDALSAPLRQILDNGHVAAPGVILDRIRSQGPTATYDAMNERVVDAFESGILDATEVLITALQVASSGALMALTTDTIVYHKNPKQSLQP